MRAAARWSSSAWSTSSGSAARSSGGGAPVAQEVPGGVEPDAGEPRPERAVVAQAAEREHRGEHRLLRRLGGEVVARRGPAGRRAQQPGVAADQLRESGAVTAAGGTDEGGVVGHLPG